MRQRGNKRRLLHYNRTSYCVQIYILLFHLCQNRNRTYTKQQYAKIILLCARVHQIQYIIMWDIHRYSERTPKVNHSCVAIQLKTPNWNYNRLYLQIISSSRTCYAIKGCLYLRDRSVKFFHVILLCLRRMYYYYLYYCDVGLTRGQWGNVLGCKSSEWAMVPRFRRRSARVAALCFHTRTYLEYSCCL